MMTSLREALGQIADRYDLRDVHAFGSRAGEIAARVRNTGSVEGPRDSDVDIAVQPREGVTLGAATRSDLAAELEDLLDVAHVDLIVLSEAPPFLAFDVIRGELLHTSDAFAQAEHELYVLRRAGDLAPLERERIRLIISEGAR
jgi:uncharacterized protein